VPDVLELGEFRVDVTGRSVSRRGELVALPPKAVETLILLAENPGKTLRKEELLETVWAGTFVEEGSLTQTISVLRKALGAESIRTIPKRGYCYVGPVGLVRKRSRARPIAITVLVVATIAAWIAIVRPKTPAPARLARLVVLPVENLSGNAQHDYVSDGLTEELIAQLSTLDAGRLAVIARTSAMKYQGTRKSIGEIARELDADYVLEAACAGRGTSFALRRS
jgi:DNA-binding winged helix-turn-helix (wHTH) protein